MIWGEVGVRLWVMATGAFLHDHLLAREKSVGDEFAGSDGDLGVGHDCEGIILSFSKTRNQRWTERTVELVEN